MYTEHNAFMEGFLEKVAGRRGLKVMLKRVGKSKSYIVGGPDADEFLLQKAFEQGPMKLYKKIIGKELSNVVENNLRRRAKGRIAGTIANGKSYISRRHRKGIPLRTVINHEEFHLKPIIGHSEILAHIYGGLKSTKGKLDYKGALNQYKHLWASSLAGKGVAKARVGRPLIEHAAIGGIGYGGYKGVQHYRDGSGDTEKVAWSKSGMRIPHHIDNLIPKFQQFKIRR